jgi:hypothetical protein
MFGDYNHFEPHSTTGQATCHICHKVIKKGEARVGYDYIYYRWNGVKWDHVRCLSVRQFINLYRRVLNDLINTTVMAFIRTKEVYRYGRNG